MTEDGLSTSFWTFQFHLAKCCCFNASGEQTHHIASCDHFPSLISPGLTKVKTGFDGLRHGRPDTASGLDLPGSHPWLWQPGRERLLCQYRSCKTKYYILWCFPTYIKKVRIFHLNLIWVCYVTYLRPSHLVIPPTDYEVDAAEQFRECRWLNTEWNFL